MHRSTKRNYFGIKQDKTKSETFRISIGFTMKPMKTRKQIYRRISTLSR